jgi:superkiller protein 3
MLSSVIRTLKKVDDALEVVVFDWALHPTRRARTLTALALVGGLAGWGWLAGSRDLSAREHYDMGTRLLSMRSKSDEAVFHLRKASKRMKKDARVWQNLGHAYLNDAQPEKAISAYQRAVGLDNSVSHLFFLGYAYVKAEKPEKALGTYQQILARSPFFYPAIAYEGVAHDKAGRYELALERFRQALAYNQNYLPAHFHMGITYVNTKEYEKSIRCFEKVIALDPTESAAYYNIACCLSLMGKVDEALAWLQISVEKGFKDFKHMDKDGDLDNLRETARYREIRNMARRAWKAEAASQPNELF